jgi:hypothetical protein
MGEGIREGRRHKVVKGRGQKAEGGRRLQGKMEEGGRRREVVGRLEIGCYLDISDES